MRIDLRSPTITPLSSGMATILLKRRRANICQGLPSILPCSWRPSRRSRGGLPAPPRASRHPILAARTATMIIDAFVNRNPVIDTQTPNSAQVSIRPKPASEIRAPRPHARPRPR